MTISISIPNNKLQVAMPRSHIITLVKYNQHRTANYNNKLYVWLGD